MQKKRKILWISIAWICAILVVLGFVIHFAFKIKNVDVELQSRLTQTETKLDAGIQNKIQGYFKVDKNIILTKFDDIIQKVEKENPYVKVNQVIKYFPNTVRVYISERIPKFKVKNFENPSEWLVLDEDFKVLSVASSDDESGEVSEYIEISQNNLQVSCEVGDFIAENEECKQFAGSIAAGVFGFSEDYSILNSIEYEEKDGDFVFNLRMKNSTIEDGNGCLISIEGAKDLTKKTFAGIKVFEECLSDGSLTNDASAKIRVYYDENNQLVVLKNNAN